MDPAGLILGHVAGLAGDVLSKGAMVVMASADEAKYLAAERRARASGAPDAEIQRLAGNRRSASDRLRLLWVDLLRTEPLPEWIAGIAAAAVDYCVPDEGG